jgi:hypothetical protein
MQFRPTTHKILPVVLAACLLLCLLPGTAMAVDKPYEVNGETYETLDAALSAVSDGGTIKLLEDATHTTAVEIDGKDITFDLSQGNLTISVASGVALTVKDCDVQLTVDGALNVQGYTAGVRAMNNGTVTVSCATADIGTAAYAESGGEIAVRGDADGAMGAVATGSGSIVTVGGDAKSDGPSGKAVEVQAGGHVEAANAIATGTDGYGAKAANLGSVAITGNATGTAYGVYATGYSEITVGGNVSATGSSGAAAFATDNSTVTIEGIVSGDPFIEVNGARKGPNEFSIDSSKADYRKYTHNSNSTVWVRDPGPVPTQLATPTGLAWNTTAGELKATWSAVSEADQYRVEYYKNGSKLPISTTVSSPGTGDVTGSLLQKYGMGSYTFTVQATAPSGSSYLDSEVSAQSAPYINNSVYHAIKFELNGGTYTGGGALIQTVTHGGSAIAPTVERSGYTFAGWDKAFNNVTSDLTVTATWSSNNGPGGAVSTPGYVADVSGGSTQGTLPVSVNTASGSASVTVSVQQTGEMAGGGAVVVSMPTIPNVSSYTLGIPVPSISTPEKQGTLQVHTGGGSVTIPSNMLGKAAGGTGAKAEITLAQGDKATLPEALRTALGARPLIRLTLAIDGRQTAWSNPNAPVLISIPYTPTAAELENPEAIVVWYIDGAGNTVCVPNGRYDAATGTVSFVTTHFSNFAVAYNRPDFSDVAANAWYAQAVSFIAAREITTGTGGERFNPEARLTRGEFLVLLMRAYGILPDENPTDNFSDAGNTYYTGYLAAAKRLGISAGTGNNQFTPAQEITRQELFTLLYNALRVLGQLPVRSSSGVLDGFADAGEIDPWARAAMTHLAEAGTITGAGGRLNPANTATRAQMAQMLSRLLSA